MGRRGRRRRIERWISASGGGGIHGSRLGFWGGSGGAPASFFEV
jgi:hypothetical protein